MTKEYHRIEKGLTLPAPRNLYGQPVISRILRLLDRRGPQESYASAYAIGALDAYVEAHDRKAVSDPRLDMLRRTLTERAADAPGGGVKTVTAEDIRAAAHIEFDAFARTRFSVRDFAPGAVRESDIEDAVRTAMYAPSVCNRQPWRCYVAQHPATIQAALKHQNGNRGFEQSIETLLIVGADLEAFTSSGERFQGWIDGGLFAMSLIYALHAKGLGSCCLNWSQDAEADRAFRKAFAIEPQDNIVMFLAVGRLKDDFLVCESPRKPLDVVIRRLARA